MQIILIKNEKRKKLNWKLNQVINIYPESLLSKPSFLPTLTGFRKSPKPRIYQPDQLDNFVEKDKIHNIEDITEKHCPSGYTWHKTKDFILLYVLLFDDCSGFPTICEAIKIDNSLHVELQYCNNPVPLPDWFLQGRNSKLIRFSMLENLPIYLKSFADDHSLLSELQKRKHYKPKGQPPYSPKMIRLALLLRYTSLQGYKLLLEEFCFPSLSLLAKLKSGNLDTIKAAELLRQKKILSNNVVLITDEMYLKKSTTFCWEVCWCRFRWQHVQRCCCFHAPRIKTVCTRCGKRLS